MKSLDPLIGIRISIILSLVLGCAMSELAWAEDESLVIATYNVRNYLSMDRRVDGKWRPDYPKSEKEKQVIRDSIRKVNPDILALQEIGSLGHLKELQLDLENEGLNYEGLAILEAGDPDRRVAALWKDTATIEVRNHTDLTLRYFNKTIPVKRGLLELKVKKDALSFSLFIAHLKSKYTDNPEDPLSLKRRTLEARSIRNRILALYPDPRVERFLVIGDLNDGPNTAPLRAFHKRGNTAICDRIACFDQHGLTWTHYYKKQELYSLVDYFLKSPGFDEIEGITGSILGSENYYEGSDHRLVWIALPLR